MTDIPEYVRVKKDGATLQFAGGGNSRVFRTGELIRTADLRDVVVRRLQNDDPGTQDLLEFVNVKGGAASAAATAEDSGELFDPKQHNVKEVMDHLRQSPPDEVQRVQKLERRGKKRGSITDYEPPVGSGPGVKRDSGRSSDGPPTQEYDSLDAAQVQALLRANVEDEDFVERVKQYETANQARVAIVNYVPENDVRAERRHDPHQPTTEGAA